MKASVKLEVLAPQLSSEPSMARDVLISSKRTEFPNIAYDDVANDSWDVVPAQIDIKRKGIDFVFLDTGTFANVPDDGFNGYRLTFSLPTGKRLNNVRVPASRNSAGIPIERFSYDPNMSTIFINVDDLAFNYSKGFSILFDAIY